MRRRQRAGTQHDRRRGDRRVYVGGGLCVDNLQQRMMDEPWSGTEIWKAFREGDVFLAFHDANRLFLYPRNRPGRARRVPQEPRRHGRGGDAAGCFGFCWIPTAIRCARAAGQSPPAAGGGEFPQQTPDPRLSYQMARFITNTKCQVEDCSRFGMIPGPERHSRRHVDAVRRRLGHRCLRNIVSAADAEQIRLDPRRCATSTM